MSYFITRVFKDKQELLKKERGPRGFRKRVKSVQNSRGAREWCCEMQTGRGRWCRESVL